MLWWQEELQRIWLRTDLPADTRRAARTALKVTEDYPDMARLEDIKIAYAVCGPDGLSDAERERDRYRDALEELTTAVENREPGTRSWVPLGLAATKAREALNTPKCDEVKSIIDDLENVVAVNDYPGGVRHVARDAADLIRRLVKR